MNRKLIAFFFFISGISCNISTTPETQLPASPYSTPFFATSRFFDEQVKHVILLRKPVYVYHNINGMHDSTMLDSVQFVQLAQEFSAKDISNANDKRNYRETIFHDVGTNSYTLNYTAVNHEVPVQGVDILLNEETNEIKRIFIRSFTRKGDTTIQEQHNWRAFKSFQINRSLSTASGFRRKELTEVKWGSASDDE